MVAFPLASTDHPSLARAEMKNYSFSREISTHPFSSGLPRYSGLSRVDDFPNRFARGHRPLPTRTAGTGRWPPPPAARPSGSSSAASGNSRVSATSGGCPSPRSAPCPGRVAGSAHPPHPSIAPVARPPRRNHRTDSVGVLVAQVAQQHTGPGKLHPLAPQPFDQLPCTAQQRRGEVAGRVQPAGGRSGVGLLPVPARRGEHRQSAGGHWRDDAPLPGRAVVGDRSEPLLSKPALLPLAALGKVESPSVLLHQIVERIGTIEGPGQRADTASFTRILAGLRFDRGGSDA